MNDTNVSYNFVTISNRMPLLEQKCKTIEWTVVGDWGELTLELNPEEAQAIANHLIEEINRS